jgi:hypothetical protein
VDVTACESFMGITPRCLCSTSYRTIAFGRRGPNGGPRRTKGLVRGIVRGGKSPGRAQAGDPDKGQTDKWRLKRFACSDQGSDSGKEVWFSNSLWVLGQARMEARRGAAKAIKREQEMETNFLATVDWKVCRCRPREQIRWMLESGPTRETVATTDGGKECQIIRPLTHDNSGRRTLN